MALRFIQRNRILLSGKAELGCSVCPCTGTGTCSGWLFHPALGACSHGHKHSKQTLPSDCQEKPCRDPTASCSCNWGQKAHPKPSHPSCRTPASHCSANSGTMVTLCPRSTGHLDISIPAAKSQTGTNTSYKKNPNNGQKKCFIKMKSTKIMSGN